MNQPDSSPHISPDEARKLVERYVAANTQREQHDYLYAMPDALRSLIEQLTAAQDELCRIANDPARALSLRERGVV